MNYGELKAAVLADSHRQDYAADVPRFIEQGIAYITASLEGYFLETSLTESSRSVPTHAYTLPAKVKYMHHVIYNDRPLTQVDESLIAWYKDAGEVLAYCMRADRLLFAAVPPTDATFLLTYFGAPAAFSADSDTNNLLRDYPQLYIESAQMYIYKRARNIDLASAMNQSVDALIKAINRSSHKKLGGAQSTNPYNVSFRSSY